jgi:hypothetical protein
MPNGILINSDKTKMTMVNPASLLAFTLTTLNNLYQGINGYIIEKITNKIIEIINKIYKVLETASIAES